MQAPTYVANLQRVVTQLLAPLRLGIAIQDMFSRSDIAGILTNVATTLGASALGIIQVLIYVGFLLAEQDDLSAKVAKLLATGGRHQETRGVIRTIVRQVQSYLAYASLSAIMARLLCVVALNRSICRVLVAVDLHTDLHPDHGRGGGGDPAPDGSGQFLTSQRRSSSCVLGALHFGLMNIAGTLILTIAELKPVSIILALTFWGSWGGSRPVSRCALTAAIAIICAHIDELMVFCLARHAAPGRKRRSHRPGSQAPGDRRTAK
jgi:hypothetical protein